jgi:hypothetical protein
MWTRDTLFKTIQIPIRMVNRAKTRVCLETSDEDDDKRKANISGDEYDSMTWKKTKKMKTFIDNEDDLADVLGEYDTDKQAFQH